MFPTESISLSSLEATHTNRQYLSIPSSNLYVIILTFLLVVIIPILVLKLLLWLPVNHKNYLLTQRCVIGKPCIYYNGLSFQVVDPLLASSPASRKINDPHHSHSLGGFPTNFLRQIVKDS